MRKILCVLLAGLILLSGCGARAQEARDARDALAESYAKARSELAVTKSALSAAQGQLTAEKEKLATAQEELAAAQEELAVTREELATAQERYHGLLSMVYSETSTLSEQLRQMTLTVDKSRAAEARLMSLFDGDPYYKADNITLSAKDSVLTIESVMSYADWEFACLQALRTYRIWLRSFPDLVQAAVDRGCDTVYMPFFYARERGHFDDSQVAAFGEEYLDNCLESHPRAPFCVLLIEISTGKVSFLGNLSIFQVLMYYESPEDEHIFRQNR
jgi:hypothetical protein